MEERKKVKRIVKSAFSILLVIVMLLTSVIVAVDGSLTLKLYYDRNTYSISFNSNKGSSVATFTGKYGVAVPIENPVRVGYSFEGWYSNQELTNKYSLTTMPETNITLYANWSAHTNIAYKVEHYGQNITDTNYTLMETENLTGTTDALITAIVKSFEGFTYNSSASAEVKSGIVVVDGSLTLKLYYNRNTTTISFADEGSGLTPITALYNSTVTTPQNLTKLGYVFFGWYLDSSLTKPFSLMPAQNSVLYPRWDFDTNIGYTVEYYQQNVAEDGYTLIDSDQLIGTAFSTVEAVVKPMEGCSVKENVSGTIAADGSLILKLYYDRNTYSVMFRGNSDKIVNLKYGATVPKEELPIVAANDPNQPGYWTKYVIGEPFKEYTFSTMPAENFMLVVMYLPNPNMPYKVEHYLWKMPEGVYELVDTEYLTGTYAITATAVPKEYEGYIVEADKPGIYASRTIVDYMLTTCILHYELNTFSITFNSNGGSTVDTISQKYSLAVEKPLDPTKENCSFKGWYLDSDLTTPYSFTIMPAQNITLYAKWE